MPTLIEKAALDMFRKNNIFWKNSYFRNPNTKKSNQIWHLHKGSSSKNFVIFVHGTGNNALFPQLALFKTLLDSGIQIFSFDLDGHGFHSTSTFDKDSLHTCLKNALDHFRSEFDFETIHLIGHSLGGIIVLLYLSMYTNVNIASASIVSAPININPNIRSFNEVLSIFHSCFLKQVPIYGMWGSLPSFGRFKRREFPVRLSSDATNGVFSYIQTIKEYLGQIEVLKKISQIDVPVQLLYGEKDFIAPVDHGKEIQHRIKNSRLIKIEKENHFTTFFSAISEQHILEWIQNWKK